MNRVLLTAVSVFLMFHAIAAGAVACGGKFPNPITDICWRCIFPINIGDVQITDGQLDNHDPLPPFICTCPAPPPVFIRYGVGISYWDPARIAEVVRTPMCSPTLNGTVITPLNVAAGTHNGAEMRKGMSYYNVHWIQYPVLSWLGLAITQGACNRPETFDVAYLSELDPLWSDDELSFIMNPEAVLFTSPPAQAACVADTTTAAATHFGLDSLFWCSGSQGSVYPLDGNNDGHVGGVDSSILEVHKMVFNLHRQLLAMDTSTLAAMCMILPQPLLRKTQYKLQMMYPIPYTISAYGFGAPSTIWAAGREFPYSGEDFSYLVFRKNTCCAD